MNYSGRVQKPFPQIFSSSPHFFPPPSAASQKQNIKEKSFSWLECKMDGGHRELDFSVTHAIQIHKAHGQKGPSKHLISFPT